MRCRKVRSLLAAYYNGELTGRRQLLIREHLASCSECRREAAVYASIREAGKALPQMKVSEDFNTLLLNRVANERFNETRTKAYLPRRAPVLSWRLVAPAVTTAVLAVLVMVNLVTPPHQDMTMAVADVARTTDDSYRVVQPQDNPNMTVNLRKDWSLQQQLAKAERISRIYDFLTDRSGFSDMHLTSTLSHSQTVPRSVAPYGRGFFKVQPVYRVYQASGSSSTGEGNGIY